MSALDQQRRAVRVVFLGHGFLLASWAPHIPRVRDHHGLSDAQLGLVLLTLAGGSVIAMIATAPISARIGAHIVCRWTAVAMAIALPLVILAPSIASLIAALVVFGGAIGAMDVAMNSVAADVEARGGRPIMSSFHAMFSLGVLTGALVSSVALRVGVRPAAHVLTVAPVALALMTPSLRTVIRPVRQDDHAQPRRRSLKPNKRSLVLGAMVLAVMVGEGSVVDWSANLLHRDLGSSAAFAAFGLAAFSCSMTAMRFAGDRINRRVGARRIVRYGGAIAAVGFATGLLINRPYAVVVGFAALGIGYANIVPVLFSAAATSSPEPTDGISSTATLGYFGFLAGPPLIGLMANHVGLHRALLVVAVLAAIVSLLANFAATERAVVAPSTHAMTPSARG